MNAPQFRLEPIVDIVRGEPLGYELLAGANRCPDLSEEGWRDFYIKLPDLFRDTIPTSVRVFINVDSRQVLDPAIIASLHAITDRDRLVVEWTEHFRTAISYEAASKAFTSLKHHGFALAIDDVGTGYDGIGRTLRVMPTFAKLDMSLTHLARSGQPMGNHDPDLVSRFGGNIAKPRFLRDLNDFFEGIGTRVIAEGVESIDDLERVRASGIRFGQGYHFAPAAEKGWSFFPGMPLVAAG